MINAIAVDDEPLALQVISAHAQFAVESYEVEAVDYLLKPFGFSRFLGAITKVRERLGNQQSAPAFFFVNTGRERHRVCTDEIRYLEGSGNYVLYHLADRRLMVRTTIKDALAQLPTAGLIRIRRSYAVALTWIDKVQDNHVYVGSARLSIGPTYREPFWARLAALSQD